MASVMMELTEEARAHMFGPWNPYFHVTKVLIATMDRVRKVSHVYFRRNLILQCSCSGWPSGSGKKLSSSQAQLGQAACLAVA